MSALRKTRATVTLVALCFVAVLGIVLASYLAVCSRAMNLSNRSFQNQLGRQLAEFGLEEGLRAFNSSNWDSWGSSPSGISSGSWSRNSTTKRATRTIVIDSSRLGQGLSATVKIRIDNYDAKVVGASWSAGSVGYEIGDLVGRSGIWYRCTQRHTSDSSTAKTPSESGELTFWASNYANRRWTKNTTYTRSVTTKEADVVWYDGSWYRCIVANSTMASFEATHWVEIAAPRFSIPSGWKFYSQSPTSYAYNTGASRWYRCNTDHWASSFSSSYWDAQSDKDGSGAPVGTDYYPDWVFRFGNSYLINDLVYYNDEWYRCNTSSTSGQWPSTGANWNRAEIADQRVWATATAYYIGDIVYRTSNSQWYRCIRDHTSSGAVTPSATDYWASTPLYSTTWDPNRGYSTNERVWHRGIWYLSQSNNFGANPETQTSDWKSVNDATLAWTASSGYSVGAIRAYQGVWYQCTTATTANSGLNPNNDGNWTAAWKNNSDVTTGAPVIIADAVVTLGDGGQIRTQLRAILTPAPLFPNAAAAVSSMSMVGGLIDSYDSRRGDYNDPTNVSTSAVLAAGSSLTITGTPAIKGYLASPSLPGGINGSMTLNGASFTSNKSRASKSNIIPQFDIHPVAGGTTLPSVSSSRSIGTPGATTPTVFTTTDLLLSSSTLTIAGPVILKITDDFRISSTGKLIIASTGSVEIHVADDLLIAGNGIDNKTKDPANCVILVSSTSGDHAFDTSADFYGVLYIPNEDLILGATNTVNIYGAVMARNVTFQSTITNLHYDTALRYAPIPGVDQPYAIQELRELPADDRVPMN